MNYVCLCIINKLNASDSLKGIISMDVFWKFEILFVFLPKESGLIDTTMKLAFLINVQKDACHLRDLISSLPADAEYYIHVDGSRDILRFMRQVHGVNVHFITRRVRTVVGGLSEVSVQVRLIREALSCGADYLVAIGGLDYPLWSNNRIKEFFSGLGGKQVISAVALPGMGSRAYEYTDFQLFNDHMWESGSFKGKVRKLARLVLSGSHIHKTLRIHCPQKTYTLYKGGTSWAITRQMGNLIVREWDENDHLKTYFSTSYRPVETFVPTVALNSSLASQCVLVKGEDYDEESLMPLTYFNGRRSSKVLTEDDFQTVCDSDKMFARQVVSDYSDGLKSMMDARRKR